MWKVHVVRLGYSFGLERSKIFDLKSDTLLNFSFKIWQDEKNITKSDALYVFQV